MRTNRNNHLSLGPQYKLRGPIRGRMTLLANSFRNGDRIYFNESPGGVECLGFRLSSTTLTSAASTSPPLPYPHHDAIPPTEICFYAVADLENAVEVTSCRSFKCNNPVVSGLLFRYTDGSQASVGLVRLDCLEEPIRIDSSCHLYVRTRLFDHNSPLAGCTYVQEVSLTAPDVLDASYSEISWDGKLEWWSTSRRSVLRLNNVEISFKALP